MRYMSTAVIVILAAVMAVYAVVQGKPTRKKAEAADRVFPGFNVKKASRVVIERAGGKLEILRKGRHWMLSSPSPFPADSDAVDTLLADMEMLRFTRKLSGDKASLAEYGLAKPRIVVRVEGALPNGDPAELKIGASDVTGGSLYVQAGGRSGVLIVDKGILSSADKGLDDWRGKLAFLIESTDRIRTIAYRLGEQTVRITKKGEERFLLDSAGQVICRAQRDAGDDIWRQVGDLRITRFLSSGKGSLAKAGLTQGWIEVSEGSDGTAGRQKKLLRHRLVVGGVCRVGGKTYDDERLVGRTAELGFFEAVFCVKAKSLDAILRPQTELRDIKLLSFQSDDLRRVEIQLANRKLVLIKGDDGWKISEPKSEKGASQRSDGQLVAKFVDDVQAFSVLGFIFPATQQSLYGLDKPQGSLLLENQDGLTEALELGKIEGDKLYVRRKGEAAVLLVHKELGDLLRPDPLAFRNRQVLSLDQSAIQKIVVQQGQVTESLTEKDGKWHLTKPLDMGADQDAMDAFSRSLSALQADRYLPRNSAAAKVLSGPGVRSIEVLVKEGSDLTSAPGGQKDSKGQTKKHRLVLGPVTATGCVGRLDEGDRVAFTLPVATCRDLHAWLADRRLADVTPSKVRKVRFVGPKGQWEIEKKGPQWYSHAGPKVDNTAVETLLTTVQGLRASRTARYGKPGKQDGAAKPDIQVTLTLENHKTISIVVGNQVRDKDGKVVGRYCWRPDRDIVYVLPSFSVSDLEKTSL